MGYEGRRDEAEAVIQGHVVGEMAYEEAVEHREEQGGEPTHDAEDHPEEALRDVVEHDEEEYLDYVEAREVRKAPMTSSRRSSEIVSPR